MGKESFHSDHEVYDMGPKDPNAPQIEGEELDQLRHDVAESGAQIGAERYERAKRDGDIDSDIIVNESAARGDQTTYTILDSGTVVDALDAVQRNADIAAAAESDARWSVRRAEMEAQGKVNAEGMILAREALHLPPKEAVPMAGLTDSGREAIAEAKRKNAARQKEHDKLNPANTVEAVRERLQEIKDDRE